MTPEEVLADALGTPHPRRWRAWWLVFTAILAVMRLVPVDEWRREMWGYRLDIWGMDHFGGRRK